MKRNLFISIAVRLTLNIVANAHNTFVADHNANIAGEIATGGS
jgi:hypothetical protein